ncbi:MAG TPA: EVE domain-containing protein [Caulobacteraceae bacterium]|jgi:predicted RNA-binding protein with PUA-like domain
MNATPSRWLLKSEPETYAFADLQRDGRTVWDGVRNAQAANFLRAMRQGDQALFYHSGAERAVVGLATVEREAYPDPGDASGRFVAVEISYLRPLSRPVSLAEMKAAPALSGMIMLRQSRLSVAPVSPAEWSAILAMAGDTSA